MYVNAASPYWCTLSPDRAIAATSSCWYEIGVTNFSLSPLKIPLLDSSQHISVPFVCVVRTTIGCRQKGLTIEMHSSRRYQTQTGWVELRELWKLHHLEERFTLIKGYYRKATRHWTDNLCYYLTLLFYVKHTGELSAAYSFMLWRHATKCAEYSDDISWHATFPCCSNVNLLWMGAGVGNSYWSESFL